MRAGWSTGCAPSSDPGLAARPAERNKKGIARRDAFFHDGSAAPPVWRSGLICQDFLERTNLCWRQERLTVSTATNTPSITRIIIELPEFLMKATCRLRHRDQGDLQYHAKSTSVRRASRFGPDAATYVCGYGAGGENFRPRTHIICGHWNRFCGIGRFFGPCFTDAAFLTCISAGEDAVTSNDVK